jgi:hypothetical protein
MCFKSLRRWMITACAAAALLGAPTAGQAACALTDWLFGNGQTTYAPAYTAPVVRAPAGACGCAPVQPVCQPCCTPTAAYRISYRPVATVTYMPVVGVDACSGCAVTTYQPRQTWTYRASLDPYTPYRAAYAPAMAVGSCSSCGCAPCSGYSASYGCTSCSAPCGGCSSCGGYAIGSVPARPGPNSSGCSACGSSIPGSYVSAGGCSSCESMTAPISTIPLPAAGILVQPATSSPTLAPPALAPGPATIGPPTAPLIPGTSEGPAKTYVPDVKNPPISPTAPINSGSSTGTSYRAPATAEGNHNVESPKIQGVPAIPDNGPQLGPQLSPPPVPRPTNENLTTSRPVLQATYFQLLPSPPAKTPAQTISAPVTAKPMPVDDGGWRHAEN